MPADGLPVGAARVDPGALGQGRGEEIEGVPCGIFPGQGPPGGLQGQLRGLACHGAVGHGLELHAVFIVKNDLRDAVGEVPAGHPVQNHVAHGDLALQGLAAALGVDNAGEPVVVHGVVFRAGGGHRRAPQPGVPSDIRAQGLRREAQGHVGLALHHVYHAGVAFAVDGEAAAAGFCGEGGVPGYRPGGGTVPPDVPVPQGVQQFPEGDIGGALFDIGGVFQQFPVHLQAGGPGGLGGEAQGRGGEKSA